MPALDFVNGIPWWFWLSLMLKVTALSAAGLGAAALGRRLPAAWRHLLLSLILLGLLLLPALSLFLPAWELVWLPPAMEQPLPADKPLAVALGGGRMPDALDLEYSGPAQAQPIGPEDLRRLRKGVLGGGLHFLVETWGALRGWSVRQWMAVAWLTVTTLLWLRLGLGLARLAGVAGASERDGNPWVLALLEQAADELGLGQRPTLAYSAAVGVPILWGWRRPLLILPEAARNWDAERLRVVFLHELAHFARRDSWTLWLGRIVAGTYWFHPLVWWVENACRAAAEQACDDIVLSRGHKASEYATHLVEIASGNRGVLTPYAPALARRTQMETRLEALLRTNVAHRTLSSRETWTVGVLFLLVLLPVSAARLRAQPATPVAFAEAELETVAETAPEPAPEPQRKKEINREGQREPESGEEWFGEGWEQHHSDRFEAAIESFQQAAALGYRPATSYYNVACGYAMLGDSDAALLWLDRALEEGFDSWKHLRKDSDLDPLRADPRFQELLERVAREEEGLKLEQNRLSAALERFDRLQADRSDDSEAWAKIGLDLLRLRRLGETVAALETAVELRPTTATTAMYNLACAHSLAGNVPIGLEWLNRAVDNGLDRNNKLRQDPDLDNLRREAGFDSILEKAEALSLSHFGNGDKEDGGAPQEIWAPAIQHFSGYVRRNPTSGRAWFNLGYSHHYAGDYDNARPAFQEAIRLGYRPGVSLYNLACGYALQNQIDLAFERLAQAVDAGFTRWDHILHDDDLISLRQDERFAQYRERSEEERRLRHAYKERELEQERR